MSVWFCHRNDTSAFPACRKMLRVNLDENPAPAIMAGGIYGDSHAHYWLEDDGKPMAQTNQQKPPYRLPSMAEIEAVPWNGFNVISTFSGCGGSCLGYKMAGFRVLWANEFIPAAQDTYRANHPGTILDPRDVRQIQPAEILEAIGLAEGEIDLLDGSPPCASFSTAGKREACWGKVKKYSDTEQRTDDLFFEFVRLLRGLRPKTFVAENVSGLVKGTAKGYFKTILAELKSSGYRVSARLLNAMWLGVPQTRQRLIFVGVREDLCEKHGVAPAHPEPLPYFYTVRDALPWIKKVSGQAHGPNSWENEALAADKPAPTVSSGGKNAASYYRHEVERVVHDNGSDCPNFNRGDVTDQPAPAVLAGSQQLRVEKVPVRVIHDTSGERSQGDITDKPAPTVTVGSGSMSSCHFRVETESVALEGYAIGEEWDKLRPGEQSEKYFSLVKPDPEKACPTVTQAAGTVGAAGVTHPFEKRKFFISELKRICAFPDDFVVTGSYAQQWERLGRAVPPVMMCYIAATVRDEILRRM